MSVDKGGGWRCGLVGLHSKGTLPGELFTTSRNWLSLGAAVPSVSARPQMSKHQNKENKEILG